MEEFECFQEIIVEEKILKEVIESNNSNYFYQLGNDNKSGLKHIMFLTYNKNNNNIFYFFTLTTKIKFNLIESNKQIALCKQNKEIYLNVSKIYKWDLTLNEIKRSTNKNFLEYNNFILNNLKNEKLNFLIRKSNKKIFEIEKERRIYEKKIKAWNNTLGKIFQINKNKFVTQKYDKTGKIMQWTKYKDNKSNRCWRILYNEDILNKEKSLEAIHCITYKDLMKK